MSAPLTPEAALAQAAADVAALLAALPAASGNVAAVARSMQIPKRTLDAKITALGLRAWLVATYPRSKRQPRLAPVAAEP